MITLRRNHIALRFRAMTLSPPSPESISHAAAGRGTAGMLPTPGLKLKVNWLASAKLGSIEMDGSMLAEPPPCATTSSSTSFAEFESTLNVSTPLAPAPTLL